MAMGPGKHDDLCSFVRERLQMGDSGGVMLIVFGTKEQSGFACQADYQTTMAMPEILEEIARQIRVDREGMK